jgi:hypothetical protein
LRVKKEKKNISVSKRGKVENRDPFCSLELGEGSHSPSSDRKP